ncbi:MAG: YdgA family protein, partial [Gammaproteobacteria bacterium]|nr:YdgA family protein [Gammaproteobacteria bacterium]
PEVVINNLGITTAQGDIKNRARVTIDSTLIDPNNPLSLLTALEMQAAGSIPKAFLESMGAMPMIQQYVTEGLVEIESDEVRYDMVFEDGQMLLFGKPYQWAGLLN